MIVALKMFQHRWHNALQPPVGKINRRLQL
jgi:hypothetical protein